MPNSNQNSTNQSSNSSSKGSAARSAGGSRPTQPGAMLDEIVGKITNAHNILIALSNDPSADDMAAAIGLSLHLDSMGKHVTAIYSGTTPSALEFLNPGDTFESNTNTLQDFVIAINKDKADHLRYKLDGDYVRIFVTPYKTRITEDDLEFSYGDFNIDLVLALDVPTEDALDAALREHGRIMHDATIVNITNGDPGKFGDIGWSDRSASSVSEMAARLLYRVDKDAKITAEEATAFLAGIVSATNRFSNAFTTPSALQMSSRLLESGANQQLVAENLSLDSKNSTPVDLPKDRPAPIPESSLKDTDDTEDLEASPHPEDASADDSPALDVKHHEELILEPEPTASTEATIPEEDATVSSPESSEDREEPTGDSTSTAEGETPEPVAQSAESLDTPAVEPSELAEPSTTPVTEESPVELETPATEPALEPTSESSEPAPAEPTLAPEAPAEPASPTTPPVDQSVEPAMSAEPTPEPAAPGDSTLLSDLNAAAASLSDPTADTTASSSDEPLIEPAPEKVVMPLTDASASGADDGDKYSKMLEDALSEPGPGAAIPTPANNAGPTTIGFASSAGAIAPAAPVVPTAPAFGSASMAVPAATGEPASAGFGVNPAASFAPAVASAPEINGVPEINYAAVNGGEVLPPPPTPPVDLSSPNSMPPTTPAAFAPATSGFSSPVAGFGSFAGPMASPTTPMAPAAFNATATPAASPMASPAPAATGMMDGAATPMSPGPNTFGTPIAPIQGATSAPMAPAIPAAPVAPAQPADPGAFRIPGAS